MARKQSEMSICPYRDKTNLFIHSVSELVRTGKGIVNKRTEVPVRSHSSYEEIIKETIKTAWWQFFFLYHAVNLGFVTTDFGGQK